MVSQIDIKRETEFYQGSIRLKMSVSNNSPSVITDVTLDFIYEDKILRIDRYEPSYEMKNEKTLLGNINGGASKSIAVYFDPLMCTKGAEIECHLIYRDAKGMRNSIFMEPKQVSVVCPLIQTDMDINVGRLKEFIEKLPSKDSRVYKIQHGFEINKLTLIAREVIEKHAVRHVRTLRTKDAKDWEIWYYGKTKVTGASIVIKVFISSEKQFLELFAATETAEALTGLLADFGRDLKENIEFHASGKGNVINVTIKDSIIQRSNLLDLCSLDGNCPVNILVEDSVFQRSAFISERDESIEKERLRKEKEGQERLNRLQEEEAFLKKAEEERLQRQKEEETRRLKEIEEKERFRRQQEEAKRLEDKIKAQDEADKKKKEAETRLKQEMEELRRQREEERLRREREEKELQKKEVEEKERLKRQQEELNKSKENIEIKKEEKKSRHSSKKILIISLLIIALFFVLFNSSEGSVSISSSPNGASIYLDNVYKGKTPQNLENIESGSHKITLKLKNYEDWDKTIDVDSGEEKSIYPKLVSRFCYWDWRCDRVTPQTDYYGIATGYNYLVFSLYIKNEADDSVSTSTSSWKLIADGSKYWPDQATTTSPYINYKNVEVGKGDKIEVQMVYLMKGIPDEVSFEHNGDNVQMKKTNYY